RRMRPLRGSNGVDGGRVICYYAGCGTGSRDSQLKAYSEGPLDDSVSGDSAARYRHGTDRAVDDGGLDSRPRLHYRGARVQSSRGAWNPVHDDGFGDFRGIRPYTEGGRGDQAIESGCEEARLFHF